MPIGNENLKNHSDSAAEPRLARWLLYSLGAHLVFIFALFFSPWHPAPATRSYPVYSVDLVGGEKLGGGSFTAPSRSPASEKLAQKVSAPKEEPKPKVEKAPKVEKVAEKTKEQEEKIKEPVKVAEKRKASEPTPPAREAVVLKPTTQKPIAKKEPTQDTNDATAEAAALDSVRERILQSAVERARARTETAAKTSKTEAGTLGAGDGDGAAAYGKGGRGGGTVRGMDFLIYQNRMLDTIKSNWAWTGRGNLRVVVHFSIKDTGEISGLKIVQPSGDSSYDESVLRAVKKSSPLSAPPESYRRDFADVELAFRPQDLGA